MTKKHRRKNAYHEAGHALVAQLLGVEVTEINMAATGKFQAFTNTIAASGIAKTALAFKTDLQICLAGEIAQGLAGYPDNHDGSLKGDHAQAMYFAVHLTALEAGLPIDGSIKELPQALHSAAFANIEKAKAETTGLLKTNYKALEKLATTLKKDATK